MGLLGGLLDRLRQRKALREFHALDDIREERGHWDCWNLILSAKDAAGLAFASTLSSPATLCGPGCSSR